MTIFQQDISLFAIYLIIFIIYAIISKENTLRFTRTKEFQMEEFAIALLIAIVSNVVVEVLSPLIREKLNMLMKKSRQHMHSKKKKKNMHR